MNFKKKKFMKNSKIYHKGDVIYFRKPYNAEKRQYQVIETFTGNPKDNAEKLNNLPTVYKHIPLEIGVVCENIHDFYTFTKGVRDDNVYIPIRNGSACVGRIFDSVVILSCTSYNLDWINSIIITKINLKTNQK